MTKPEDGFNWQYSIERREFLRMTAIALGGLAVGPGILAACAKEAATTTTELQRALVTTQLSWIENVQFAGWWYALKEGLFEQEALDVEFLSGAEAQVQEVVAGGAADVGIVGFLEGVVDAVNAGSDFVIFGAQYQDNPAGLMSLPENPVRTPADMMGKRIGVQGDWYVFETIARLAGLDPEGFTPVQVGFDPAPLAEGDIDAYFCYVTNQPITLRQQGLEPVVVTLGDLGFRQYGDILIAKRDYLNTNHDAIVGWLRATVKGWELNFKNLQQGTDYSLEVGEALGLDPAQQLEQNTTQQPLMESDLTREKGYFWIDKEEISGPMYAGLSEAGKETLPDVDSLVDLSILEDVFIEGSTLTG